MKTVTLVSLGCAKNRVDAEHLLARLAERGLEIVDDPDRAQVVIVNTCGFIREAVEESIEEILEAARWKEQGVHRTLVVAGCLPKRYPDLASELPEVDGFFTPEDILRIPDFLTGTRDVCGPTSEGAPRLLTQPPHSAYLKIAEGCSNRCNYCTIPAIRGAFRSLPEDALVAEAEWLATRGTVELNLVAQDVTSYGGDRGDPSALVRLLRRIEALAGVRWIRLLYAYPRPLPPGLVEVLAEGGKTVPYLDMPIQHVDPRILRVMGRNATGAEVEGLLSRLQREVPGLVLRTTAIVGFPGETDSEFGALVELARRVRFHHLGVFCYSPEEGTPAAQLKPRVPRRIARERQRALLEVQAEVSAERNREFLGRTLDVLVDGVDEEGDVIGRTYGQAPEVDGFTRLRGYEGDVEIGSFVRACVVEAGEYDLVAQVTARS